MDKLKVGIIGCGQIADGHVSEIQKLKNAIVTSVCDAELIIAEQLATRFGILKYYRSLEEMLTKEKLNVLHICTPPASHLSLAKTAVDAGCHVYVEKPLAMNYEETVELVNYVAQGGKKLTIGHNSEFDPPSIELRNLVKNGILGDPVHIESWYGYNLDGPFGKAILASPEHWVHKLPGRLFHNNINHMLNKITEYLDDDKPLIQVMAWRNNNRTVFGDVRDALYDELRTIIKGNKVSAYGTFSSSVRPVGHYVRVYGTKSIIDMDFTSRSVSVDRGTTYPSAIGRLFAGYDKAWQTAKSAIRNTKKFYNYDYHYFSGMGTLINGFYDSILHDAPLPISTSSITRIAWIMDEIFAQIKEQQQS
jgi:predicted dehydrogenase